MPGCHSAVWTQQETEPELDQTIPWPSLLSTAPLCPAPPPAAAPLAERQAAARHGGRADGRRHGLPVQAGALWAAAHQRVGARCAARARLPVGHVPLPGDGQAGAGAAGAQGRGGVGGGQGQRCAWQGAMLRRVVGAGPAPGVAGQGGRRTARVAPAPGKVWRGGAQGGRGRERTCCQHTWPEVGIGH